MNVLLTWIVGRVDDQQLTMMRSNSFSDRADNSSAEESGENRDEFIVPAASVDRVELLIAYSNFLPEVEKPLEALSRLHERPDSDVNLTLVSPPRKLRKRPPKSVVAEMVSAYQAGVSTRQLTRKYDIPKTSVLTILHAEGVVRAHQRITEQQIQRATYLIASGKSVTVTAQELGVAPRTLYSQLKQRGLPTRAS
jgi:hypothetical protein